jgi:hypothetical protein
MSPIPSQLNLVDKNLCLCEIRFNVVFPSTPKRQNWEISFSFLAEDFFFPYHCITLAAHPAWFY